jgi:hypothetical protein
MRAGAVLHMLVAALAAASLLVRLAGVGPAPVDTARIVFAAFGEHALCLGAASDHRAATPPLDQRLPTPDERCADCCKWQLGAGAILAGGTGDATRIVFATPIDLVAAAAVLPTRWHAGEAKARAPPIAQA